MTMHKYIISLVLISSVCTMQAGKIYNFNYKLAITLNPLTESDEYSQQDIRRHAVQIPGWLNQKEDWRRELLHPDTVELVKTLMADGTFVCQDLKANDMKKAPTNEALQKILDTNNSHLAWNVLPIYLAVVACAGAVIGGSVALATFIKKKNKKAAIA